MRSQHQANPGRLGELILSPVAGVLMEPAATAPLRLLPPHLAPPAEALLSRSHLPLADVWKSAADFPFPAAAASGAAMAAARESVAALATRQQQQPRQHQQQRQRQQQASAAEASVPPLVPPSVASSSASHASA